MAQLVDRFGNKVLDRQVQIIETECVDSKGVELVRFHIPGVGNGIEVEKEHIDNGSITREQVYEQLSYKNLWAAEAI